jgi:hypothetical protein
MFSLFYETLTSALRLLIPRASGFVAANDNLLIKVANQRFGFSLFWKPIFFESLTPNPSPEERGPILQTEKFTFLNAATL